MATYYIRRGYSYQLFRLYSPPNFRDLEPQHTPKPKPLIPQTGHTPPRVNPQSPYSNDVYLVRTLRGARKQTLKGALTETLTVTLKEPLNPKP